MLSAKQQQWRSIVAILLNQHLGLALNDTSFCENACVRALHDAGIRPYEAVNAIIEKHKLTLLNDNPCKPHATSLSAVDELIALMQLNGELRLGRKP